MRHRKTKKILTKKVDLIVQPQRIERFVWQSGKFFLTCIYNEFEKLRYYSTQIIVYFVYFNIDFDCYIRRIIVAS